MALTEKDFPIGQRIALPGHIPDPVVLATVRHIGAGFECRVRLQDGSSGEAILSLGKTTGIVNMAGKATK